MYFGVWRLHPGAEIKESSFDVYTGVIGAYKIPLNFAKLNFEKGQSSPIAHVLYKTLNSSKAMLACISITSSVYMCVYDTFCEIKDLDTKASTNYPYPNIVKHRYVPIGYTRTYQKCVAVYQYPYYLLMNADTEEVVDFPGEKVLNVNTQFPMSLFRTLVDNDCDAIWLDTSNGVHLIKKGECL